MSINATLSQNSKSRPLKHNVMHNEAPYLMQHLLSYCCSTSIPCDDNRFGFDFRQRIEVTTLTGGQARYGRRVDGDCIDCSVTTHLSICIICQKNPFMDSVHICQKT